MLKLLSAGFSRLFKYKLFWAINAVFAVGAAFLRIMTYTGSKSANSNVDFDDGFFVYIIGIAIASAVFCSLFVGREYSDGTIRNKLIVGHSRAAVFFSELIVCFSASLAMIISYMAVTFAVGVPLLGGFVTPVNEVIKEIALSLLLSLCFNSLFVMIALICSNKAANAITAILLSFAMLFCGAVLKSALSEPEIYEGYSVVYNGVEMHEDDSPNPNYLSGTKRVIAEKLYDIIPGCQAMRLSGVDISEESDTHNIFALYSGLITVLSCGAGLIIFKKKNIK